MNLQITAASMQKMPDFCILLTLLKFCCSSIMLFRGTKTKWPRGRPTLDLIQWRFSERCDLTKGSFLQVRAFYHTLAEMWSKRKQSSVDLLRSSEFTDGLETRIIVRRHLWSQFHKKVGPLKLKQLTDLLQHAAFKCAHIIYALKKKKRLWCSTP